MQSTWSFFALLLLVHAATTALAENEAGSRPNILLLLSDDMGYAQPGFTGGNKALRLGH